VIGLNQLVTARARQTDATNTGGAKLAKYRAELGEIERGNGHLTSGQSSG
jgi:hypothetical protein